MRSHSNGALDHIEQVEGLVYRQLHGNRRPGQSQRDACSIFSSDPWTTSIQNQCARLFASAHPNLRETPGWEAIAPISRDEQVCSILAPLTLAEQLTVWCYLYLMGQVAPSAQPSAHGLYSRFRLPKRCELMCAVAIDRMLQSLPRSPSVGDAILGTPVEVRETITKAVVRSCQSQTQQRVPLVDVSLDEIRHETDVDDAPGLRKLSGALSDLVNRGMYLRMRAGGLEVNSRSFPWLHERYRDTCRVLGITSPPKMYLFGMGSRAYLLGTQEPSIIVESAVASLYDAAEVVFLLGRQLGHLLAGHQHLMALDRVTNLAASGIPLSSGVQNLIAQALSGQADASLRAAEYTADRVGYLACQNHQAVLRTLVKMAGFPPRHMGEINCRELVAQADAFRRESTSDVFSQAMESLGNWGNTHPFVMRRTCELLDWIAGDDYSQIARQLIDYSRRSSAASLGCDEDSLADRAALSSRR